MSQPSRNAAPTHMLAGKRTFFATTRTCMGQRIFQSERNANLLIDVLRSLVAEHKFQLLDFVVMPDHLHLLLQLDETISIEKAMQFIKGRFSYRMKSELGVLTEVWQRGFSEVRTISIEEIEAHQRYIANNPVRAGLVRSAEEYPFCFAHLARRKAQSMAEPMGAQGLKPSQPSSLLRHG
jgi:putative transposase